MKIMNPECDLIVTTFFAWIVPTNKFTFAPFIIGSVAFGGITSFAS